LASNTGKFSLSWVVLVLFFALVLTWVAAFLLVPVERHQGSVYRIIYVHVPFAFAAFLSSFLLFVLSINALITKNINRSFWLRSAAEIGCVTTFLTLLTGSIWGKPTWGVWWTWDARLTTTLLLLILYAGFLLLYHAVENERQRLTFCSLLGILIFIDVPVIYKSVTWWRALHQPPSMFRADGRMVMAAPIVTLLILSTFFTLLLVWWFIIYRAKNLLLRNQIEKEAYRQLYREGEGQ